MNNLTEIFSQNVLIDENTKILDDPVRHCIKKNFLPYDVAIGMYNEIKQIDNTLLKHFTRNGSNMYELIGNYNVIPIAFNLIGYLNSGSFLKSLEDVTGIKGLISDPYILGAGYSKIYNGDRIKVHTDFNWNDNLKLHRACSLIIYLSPDWKEEYGGALDFYDKFGENIVSTVPCLFNTCLIWNYNKFGFHGCTQPVQCPSDKFRAAFRLFYYTSNSTFKEDDPPHRSQYWKDNKTNLPYDIKGYK